MTENASDLRGFLVVAGQEASQLGQLSGIYIDPDTRRLAGFCYRTRRLGGDQFFVPIAEVRKVGKDVVLISSEEVSQQVSEDNKPPGRSLKDLQGSWVTTTDGYHLGTLVDLDFSDDWAISELSLTDDKRLAVGAEDIRVGDEIVVPAAYAARVEETRDTKGGFLQRTFGGEALEDTKKALKRALAKASRKSKGDGENQGD